MAVIIRKSTSSTKVLRAHRKPEGGGIPVVEPIEQPLDDGSSEDQVLVSSLDHPERANKTNITRRKGPLKKRA